MNDNFDELAKGLAQSLTRRGKLKGFSAGLAGMAVACFWLATPANAQLSLLGPAVELSQPNPLWACDDGFRPGGSWDGDDAAEPIVAANPVNPNNVVAAWMGGFVQNIVAGVSFDGGRTWQQVPLPLTVCSGGAYLGAGDVWLSFAPN